MYTVLNHDYQLLSFFLISFQYPAEAPEFSADLPVPLVITWTSQVHSLKLRENFLNRNIITEKLRFYSTTLQKIGLF